MTRLHHTRRQALLACVGAGVAMNFIGGMGATRAAPGLDDRKLVVIICRGGLDGLSVAPPVGDKDYARLRGEIAIAGPETAGGALPLTSDFGLHPSLTELHGLALAGQARFAPAIASPDRQRSHFEAQDTLENGGAAAHRLSTGWLNRAFQVFARGRRASAMSIGDERPLILAGPAPTSSWSPNAIHVDNPRLQNVMLDLYADDPVLGPALTSGLATETMAASFASPTREGQIKTSRHGGADQARAFGLGAGRLMASPEGPSIVAMSLYGFDTHNRQGGADGYLAGRLVTLDQLFGGLRAGLGDSWNRTAVIAVTEFGRTARVNGTGGTDHGTGTVAIVAGGATKPGGIIGDWPTLAQDKLFEDRDLAPTLDTRSIFKGVLADHLGISLADLNTLVFPDSADIRAYGGLVT